LAKSDEICRLRRWMGEAEGNERGDLGEQTHMEKERQFEEWSERATGHAPYPFQIRFACAPACTLSPSLF
jgi:hypothetical protein